MAPAAQPEVQEKEMDGSAPLPSNFFHTVEQEFPSLYQVVVPEEEAARFAHRITAEGNDKHHWMEEGTQPDPESEEPAPDEMIRMCRRMLWYILGRHLLRPLVTYHQLNSF